MIFFNRNSEKKAEKKRLEEQRKLEEQQQKELKQKQKDEEERLKQQKKQEEEQRKIEENKDIATLAPVPIAEDEQILYRWNVTRGTFRTKVVTSHFVTNYEIATIFDVKTIRAILLENISDVVAVNTHREYEGGYRGYTVGTKGARYTVGGQRGKSVSYGDLVISSPVAEDQIWHNIRDYNSVIRLIKSLRKTRIEQLKSG